MARRKDVDDDDFIEGQGDADDEESPSLEAEAPPARTSSSTVTSGASAAPRMARYGEGAEGRPARRERGVQGSREGFFGRVGTFWRDVRQELRRVTWPSLREVQNTTIITIVAVAFFAAYLWSIDQIFAKLLGGFHKLFGG
ncbi:MAG: preprotein translocase subunit SecE [Acidobacteria bacterium]|nr:preprotein translocase subunit SecE [Acidobacteriota bacterium]